MTRTFDEIAPALEALAIEVPSWAYGNSGTRFKIGSVEYRILNDDSIEAVVPDPRRVVKV